MINQRVIILHKMSTYPYYNTGINNQVAASAPPPPAYYPPDQPPMQAKPVAQPAAASRTMDEKRNMLNQLARDHNINPMFKEMLWQINEKHIITLCDDSGSMNATVDGSNKTRWDELRKAILEILDIALIFDPVGMDVHFLNRAPQIGVKFSEQITYSFSAAPNGGTPLIAKLTEIEQQYRTLPYGKLLIIATDGEPSDDNGQQNYPKLKSCMARLVEQGYNIAFLICTDQDYQVQYINDIDRQYQQVDVTDDYKTELKEVRRAQGSRFQFSYGDYIVKLLVGSIDHTLDQLDERRLLLSPMSSMSDLKCMCSIM